MIHTRKSFCFSDPAGVENGDTFVECNLEQLEPNTAILAGKTGLTFQRCRLINCVLPGDAVVEGGNSSQIDFCTNLHPGRVAKGQEACVENCVHVTSTDEIWEGGVLIDTIYHYADASA